MSAKVNLTKKVVIGTGKRFCPVSLSDNGRVKPDWVIVANQPEHHPEGTYYIDWTEDGRRRRASVGKSASNALAKQLRKQTELKAISQGIEVVPEDNSTHRGLQAAIALYLDEIGMTRKPRTLNAYSNALLYFQESCTKVNIEDVDRMDMVKYAAFLRDEKGQAPRSCYNKFECVMTFLKTQDVQKLVRKEDWPRYVEEEPEVYEREEVDEFFKACNSEERLIFEFFLMTGMREQEVMHCTWRNINFKHDTVSMRWNPEFNWTPKMYKEREIPIPTKLLGNLAKNQPSDRKRDALLFPTADGKPNGHFHRMCKGIAKRAGLDPDGWWLHKFRATFATWHLQGGADLRTVQKWLGQTDMESTLRYLRSARGVAVHDKVNATFA
jgi:integrase/recombinase XerD